MKSHQVNLFLAGFSHLEPLCLTASLLPVRYSLGSSNYTSRPPTGVDLALGLSGYDKVGNNDFPAHKQRPPSTLQPLKDEDEEMKRRVASLDTEEAKWNKIREEVEVRRQRHLRKLHTFLAFFNPSPHKSKLSA